MRPRISKKEYELVKQYREQHKALEEECKMQGIPVDAVDHYWHKGKNFSLHVKTNKHSYLDIRQETIKEMNKYSPNYPTIKRKKTKDNHALIIDPADVHIGKLATKEETGQAYNMEIAFKRTLEGIEGLLDKAKGFNIDKIIYIGGNDKLHTDTPFRTTTSGTPQDTDGMWYENYRMAKELDIKAIEMLLTVADVHYKHCPSNHDFQTGLMLADTINSWFRNCENFNADVSIAHRKYALYGVNLLGFTHGDGAKESDLPDLMKTQAKKAWALAKFGYWYVHHIHHKNRKLYKGKTGEQIEKDYDDVTVLRRSEIDPFNKVSVEYVRTPSPADSWHDRNGYVNVNAIEGFLHHENYGQVARLSHLF